MSQETNEIDSLIIAALTGQLSETEKEKLDRWINRSPDNRAEYEALKQVWRERTQDRTYIHSADMLEKVWAEGAAGLPQGRKRAFFSGYFLKIAASALILFAVSFLIWENIIKTGSEMADTAFVAKSAPAGQKSRIALPDGSFVWLNSASSITYDENFASGIRKISLQGEAYFEVSEDSLRPFVVSAGDVHTTALGTSFNIDSYEEGVVRIALLSGKVKVDGPAVDSALYLEPGDGIEARSDGVVGEYHFVPEEVALWKEGILALDGVSFEVFKDKIEKWYGVQVTVIGRAPDGWSIRGRFDNESLDNMLRSVSFNKNFRYELNGRSLTIKF